MTPEKKIQEYVNALNAARRIYTAMKENGDSEGMKNLETIFPVLDENEDERIKREIIKYIKTGTYRKDWIAWLEKQGEPVEINPTEFDTRLQALIGKFDSLPKEELIGSLSFWLNIVQNDGTYKDEEKQGEQKPYGQRKECWDCQFNYAGVCKGYCDLKRNEQKPFDYENANIQQKDFVPNVEPMFKVGNWYQCTKDFFGKGVTFDKNTAYYCAKEGCLQDEYGCHIAIVKDLYDNFKLWTIRDVKDGDVVQLGKVTAIFKEFIGNGNCRCYCSVCNGEFEIPSQDDADNSYGCHDTVPATKEQRNLFEKAMADAGYMFDFEKKELKKIGRKLTWIEDDEKRAERLIGWLDTLVNYIHHDATVSLDLRRERMQQAEQLKTWLKSIRLQNTWNWKPSEEQMNALDSTLQYSQVSHNSFEHLNSLYNDLKKLK